MNWKKQYEYKRKGDKVKVGDRVRCIKRENALTYDYGKEWKKTPWHSNESAEIGHLLTIKGIRCFVFVGDYRDTEDGNLETGRYAIHKQECFKKVTIGGY